MIKTASIPPIVLASIVGYLGIYYLYTFRRIKENREFLSFAVTCLFIAAYDVSSAGLYSATSITEGAFWIRLQYLFLSFFAIAFIQFVCDYTAYSGRKLNYLFYGIYTAVAAVQLLVHNSLIWREDIPDVKLIHLPFDFQVIYFEPMPGPFSIFQTIAGIAGFVYVLWISIDYYRRKDARRALPLLISVAIFFLGFLSDALMVIGVFEFIYISEYAFLAMVILMALSLSRQLVDATFVRQELIRSEEKHQDILSSIEDGYFEVDLKGNLLFFNEAMHQILGYEKAELIGKNFKVLMNPKTAETVYRTFNYVFRTRMPAKAFDWRVIRKDRTERFLETSVSLVKEQNGRPAGFRGIARDVTEKKMLQHQLFQAQKMKAVGTLAGGLAHDFNNLLMGIMGRTGLIRRTTDNPQQVIDHVKAIETYVESGANITRQLLGFAREEKYELCPTNVNELIEKSADLFSHTRPGIRIHLSLSPDIRIVDVNRAQIEQVLLNLFINASDAMSGSGDLYLSTSNTRLNVIAAAPYEAIPGRYIRITVTDTGTGMDEETRSRIFEPFFSTKERHKGTGLGLASAYGIIRSHNGTIQADSQLNHGTTFIIHLPVEVAEVTASVS